MTPLATIQAECHHHLDHTLLGVDVPKPDYRGKVRDVFARGEELFLIATDRVSAFDQVLGTVPLKGALLTQQAAFWLKKAESILPTHLKGLEDPQVMRCKKAEALKFEVIVRGYLAGSLMREDPSVRGQAYGLKLDPNLKPYEAFSEPILTPTSKAEGGEHDAPMSFAEIVGQGWASAKQVDEISKSALALFKMGQAFALEQGLLLVDTKYEYGLWQDEIILIDEIHTADSSRYWLSDTYDTRVAQNLAPDMLDKERLRRVLIEQGYNPSASDARMPALTPTMREDLAVHYWQLCEMLTGEPFLAPELPASERVPAFAKSRLM